MSPPNDRTSKIREFVIEWPLMSTHGRAVLLVLTLVVPGTGVAQTADGVADAGVGQPQVVGAAQATGGPGERERERWSVDLTGGFFLEAWDLNRFQEQLAGAVIGLSRRMTPNWTLGVEASLLHVNQEPLVDVFLPAMSVMLRWRALRFGDTSLYVEGGGGASYASNEVPNRGTRFNLVSQTGVGLARALNARIELVGGLRWLHLSNNSLDGRSRNPDIQALGLYVGWRVN